MFKTKIRKKGNPAAITLSSEKLAVFGVKEVDTVYVKRSDDNVLKIHAPTRTRHLIRETKN